MMADRYEFSVWAEGHATDADGNPLDTDGNIIEQPEETEPEGEKP